MHNEHTGNGGSQFDDRPQGSGGVPLTDEERARLAELAQRNAQLPTFTLPVLWPPGATPPASSANGTATSPFAQLAARQGPAQANGTASAAPTQPHPTVLLPPSAMGELVQWFESNARQPVREVAVATALAVSAGICGRAFTTPTDAGLNLYLLLVAHSAIGKEEMHKGSARVVRALRVGLPSANEMIRFSDYASGAALAKACAEGARSFVNIASEFGKLLKRMGNPRDQHANDVRTAMTKLYSKSGPEDIAPNLVYSEKTYVLDGSVALSFAGESTPGTFRAALTEEMMEDGYLSRFTILEYDGPRPADNKKAGQVPMPVKLLEGLARLAAVAVTTLHKGDAPPRVSYSDGAARLLDAFNDECLKQINSTKVEGLRQAWNRAHLKAQKITSLQGCVNSAVAGKWPPYADEHAAQWAIDLVRRDIAIFVQRYEAGDIGNGDDTREKKLLHMMHEYITQPLPASYGIPSAMARDGVVPRVYLQRRTSTLAAFTTHPSGSASRALDDALRSLCDSGYLAEMDKNKVGEAYTYMGRCFRVVRLPKAC